MTKNILNAHVHRLHKGVLETYGPGDEAPDWVTNTDLFVSDSSLEVIVAGAINASKLDVGRIDVSKIAANAITVHEITGDGLDDLTGKQLADVAETEGIAKTGSKKVLIERIRGHRAASAGIALAPVAEETGLVNDRDVLVARALELGFDDVDDNTSEVELQALIDSKE